MIEKQLLFCVFHPSDFYLDEKYISFVELKRDVEIFFMIEDIQWLHLYSASKCLDDIYYEKTSIRIYYGKRIYSNIIMKEKLDGYLNSTIIKATVEIALLNDLNIFNVIKTEKIIPNRRTWTNIMYYPYLWKHTYPICDGVELELNERYKEIIKKYIDKNNSQLIIDKKIFAFGIVIINPNNIIKFHN